MGAAARRSLIFLRHRFPTEWNSRTLDRGSSPANGKHETKSRCSQSHRWQRRQRPGIDGWLDDLPPLRRPLEEGLRAGSRDSESPACCTYTVETRKTRTEETPKTDPTPKDGKQRARCSRGSSRSHDVGSDTRRSLRLGNRGASDRFRMREYSTGWVRSGWQARDHLPRVSASLLTSRQGR